MKTIATAAALASALLLAASSASAARTTYKTAVDGTTYRVVVAGDAVEVASKAFVVGQTVEERDRMRKAVKQATGCAIADELFYGNNHLHGKLTCGEQIVR